MTKLTDLGFGSNSSNVGDIKARYAPTVNPPQSGLMLGNGQEWLLTGYLVPYAAKYAEHLTLGIGRGLFAYDAVAEQGMASGSPNSKAQFTVDYLAGRYYFFPDYVGGFTVNTKLALDSAATAGTLSTALPALVNITEARGFFLIKSGANAGRAFVSTNGDVGYRLLYQSGALGAAWVDANLGAMVGGHPRVVAGKPDGSLLVALADTLDNASGAGNIKTSVNGGSAWTSQTCSLAGSRSVYEGAWCATLNKFVYVALHVASGLVRYYTTTDGYTLTQEAGTVRANPGSLSTSMIADNGAATLIVGEGSTLHRSVGGGAFGTIATPRQLLAICAAGASLYALNGSGGIELSTDNGTTWTVLGQVNGPALGAFSGGGYLIKAANGNLFVSHAGGVARFPLQPLPTLTPDRIGAVYSAPTGLANSANFVRIY